MNLIMNPSPSFRWALCYVEWIMIAGITLGCIIDGTFQISTVTTLYVITCLVGYAVLSLFFPIERPLWQREIYILIGILLALSVKFIGTGLELFFYLYIAKSCFLLNRKNLLLTVILIVSLGILTSILAVPGSVKAQANLCEMLQESKQIKLVIIEYFSNNLVSIPFIIAFSFMIISEQKSRQRAEALTQQVETLAAALERTRIARDIHDSLGHSLTNLNSRLAIAQQKLRQHDIDSVSQAIDTAKFLASQCIEDVSRSLKTMRQTDFNLNQALTTLVEQLRYNQAFNIKREINLPQLPLSNSHHIYCIVKEGLTNIQKHACASQVFFRGKSTPEGILLELRDDGQGFDHTMPYSGLGLKGMIERVELLGGNLIIKSTPGLGTQIKIIIPL
ncbi:sensor histidine kinase [Nostoc flagelliforme FACHB-838]|uniref:Oxygen sensor histidine kinase NreB n=2 Tax=Nostoc flagelliforme TaxID=1306274 RepID=A0ABR8DY33_9NOSO|nr:sensor histidine kinase [Nostoc flagelliforme FACHB-838]